MLSSVSMFSYVNSSFLSAVEFISCRCSVLLSKRNKRLMLNSNCDKTNADNLDISNRFSASSSIEALLDYVSYSNLSFWYLPYIYFVLITEFTLLFFHFFEKCTVGAYFLFATFDKWIMNWTSSAVLGCSYGFLSNC